MTDDHFAGTRLDRATHVYDKWKWHYGGAFPRGTPKAQAFVHIAMYLTWIILHDLYSPEFFELLRQTTGRDRLSDVRSRRRTAIVLRNDVDGVLANDMMSAEGEAFSDFYYPDEDSPYLEDWSQAFGQAADVYAVPDGWDTYALIETRIDARYAWWKASLS